MTYSLNSAMKDLGLGIDNYKSALNQKQRTIHINFMTLFLSFKYSVFTKRSVARIYLIEIVVNIDAHNAQVSKKNLEKIFDVWTLSHEAYF